MSRTCPGKQGGATATCPSLAPGASAMKLTARMIDSLSCPTGKNDATYFDDITKGFGLRCRSSGVRRWVVMYENSSGQTRRITIGAPDVLSLDKARAVARKLLAEKALG